jgi:hypothetical protein
VVRKDTATTQRCRSGNENEKAHVRAANAQAQRRAAGMPHDEGTLSFGSHPSVLPEVVPRGRCSLLLGVCVPAK